MYIKVDAITYLEYSLEQMLLDVFLYSHFHWQCIELPYGLRSFPHRP
jgi:hypothetical protein